MKLFSFLLVVLLALATPSYAQWSDFDMYVIPAQWGDKTEAYFKANKFKNYMALTQGGITPSLTNDTTFSPAKIKWYLEKHYPKVGSEGVLLLDWESEILMYLRDYPETHPRFKYAEGQWIGLINEVRKFRPKVKIGLYGMTLRAFWPSQLTNYNRPGALDNILSKIDIICPTLYIMYAEEEIGRERQIQYLKDNLNFALTYGKRLNKPVIPFMWHRIQESNKVYTYDILQKEVFADYIKFVKNYTLNDYKVSGVFLWEDPYWSKKLTHLKGVNNWLKGRVHNRATYDLMTMDIMKSVVKALNEK